MAENRGQEIPRGRGRGAGSGLAPSLTSPPPAGSSSRMPTSTAKGLQSFSLKRGQLGAYDPAEAPKRTPTQDATGQSRPSPLFAGPAAPTHPSGLAADPRPPCTCRPA